jgi:CheY-like chemotaxis protein
MSAPPLAVLVADDSAVARVSVARKLREDALPVTEAHSAALARQVDPKGLSCALLDLDLGDGYGVDVAAVLRAAAPALPIAFFSAESGDSPLVQRAAAFGPVFHKPSVDAAIAWIRANARK